MNYELELLLKRLVDCISRQREETILKGDSYNLFKVIHMTSNETSVHSAFISDLLNPKGSHGRGPVFLESFLSIIDYPDFNYSTDGCKVDIEKYIGPKTKTAGGRLDIIITNKKGQAIIIENKIYAEDKDAQMLRYYNYAKTNFNGNCLLLYLSLDGMVHDVEKTTQGEIEVGKDFKTISYKDHIIPWLEECIQKSHEIPMVSYGITHYLNLIMKLTKMDMNDSYKKELSEIVLSNPEHIRNLIEYEAVLSNAKYELFKQFWQVLLKEFTQRVKNQPMYVLEEGKNCKNRIVNASPELLYEISSHFKDKNDRRNYDYRFGIAYKIGSKDNQDLMLGVVIDGAVSCRAFVVSGDTMLNKNQICQSFLNLMCFPEIHSIECNWVREEQNKFILAKYPFVTYDEFNFNQLNSKTLDRLASMETCVTDIVDGILEYQELICRFLE